MRDRYYFPFEEAVLTHDGRNLDKLIFDAVAVDDIDSLMNMHCGVERGRTKEIIYRQLGWLAACANMGKSGGVPQEASTGSATDTD